MVSAANELGPSRFVYMIRAGHVVKVGCTRNPISRYKSLRPFLRIYGDPVFIGYVVGDLDDEAYLYKRGEQLAPGTREILLGTSLPDISEIWPDRQCYRITEEQLAPKPTGGARIKGEKTTKLEIAKQPQFKGATFIRVEGLLRQDLVRTYTSISSEVGVSRERVRQIAKAIGDTGKARSEIRQDARFQRKTRIPHFRQLAEKWLNEQGFYYCPDNLHQGGRVLDVLVKHRKCSACGMSRQNSWLARPQNKAKRDAYWKSERGKEVTAKAGKKWVANHPEHARRIQLAAQRRHYQAAMADPEKKAKLLEYYRQRYQRRKEKQSAK